MLIGYARTSTVEQKAGLDAQIAELTRAGCETILRESISSVSARPELDRILGALEPGDTLVVTKLDRFARSISDLCRMMDLIESKKATLRILAMNLDTSTPTGKLMLNLLGSVAQFEREIMLERQRAGIEKAKAEGKYTGRAPVARDQLAGIVNLKEMGFTVPAIASQLGISQSSVNRLYATHQRDQSRGNAA